MSEQEIVPQDLPCVFGQEIHKDCPVRKEIGKHENIDLKKWIKPKAKIFDEADELITHFTEVLNYEFSTLSDFCGICPFLSYYEKRHS